MNMVEIYTDDRIFTLVKVDAGWRLFEKIKVETGLYETIRKAYFSTYGEANYFLAKTYPELVPEGSVY